VSLSCIFHPIDTEITFDNITAMALDQIVATLSTDRIVAVMTSDYFVLQQGD
jgi:hypothetical protein